jgi:hypothetical protein
MRLLIAAALVAFGITAPEETKLGAGVTLKDATPVKAVIERPEEFVGKTIRVDGVATAVCQHMGCWMAVADESNASGATVRLKVDHGGPIVFPVTAKGKQVSAEGIFEVATGEDAKEAGADAAKGAKVYQLKATGALIR